MTSNWASDVSEREDVHDWHSYLAETNSEAAPARNFRQALIPPSNEFTVGDKLESVDPRNQDSWCIGTIIEKDGPRLRIRLDGTDDRNDFWRLVDSADIRCYGTTAKLGGQIVPPLGFQLNSTRWAKYFERHVKHGPFAAESCFKPQPPKPEKNLFTKGQKLEAVDPRHPHIICPATVSDVIPGDYRIVLSLDGWSSMNNFKIDYCSRDIFPVGWCQLAGVHIAKVGGILHSRPSNESTSKSSSRKIDNIRRQQSKHKESPSPSPSNDSSYLMSVAMDEKNNNVTTKRSLSQLLIDDEEHMQPIDSEEINESKKKKRPIVIVYFNYLGDNSGIFLNPQRFRLSMPEKFGPNEYHIVLAQIFNACIKCTFKQSLLIERILEVFPVPKDEEKDSFTPIKLENGTVVHVEQLETVDSFWDVIGTFQNIILSGNDLFISTAPPSIDSISNDSLSHSPKLFIPLDNDEETLQSDQSPIHNKAQRRSTSLTLSSDYQTANNTLQRSDSNEKHHVNKKSFKLLEHQCSRRKSHESRGQEQYEEMTPSEVAAFIRSIDPTLTTVASRFLQEEIDGKALLLLTTDTLMRHMGLKLGPSLKIIYHIEKLKRP